MDGQLWIAASPSFALPGFPGRPLSSRWGAPNLRALFWPSGTICWQVNLYLIYLRRHGLAVSTVNTYASEISLFIRFMWDRKLDIATVDDEVLIDFADSLVLSNKSGNHVNRLLLRVLHYFSWYQQVFPEANVIGLPGTGCRISISRSATRTKHGAVAGKVRHISMVPPSVRRTVRPISFESISKLLSACDTIGSTRFKRNRDRCIVTLLADAGIRRDELTWVTCENVKRASVNGRKLHVRTSKRRGHPERVIPLPAETMTLLLEFLEVTRALRIRRLQATNPLFLDEGWFFCTVSGKKISPSTVSQLFSELRISSQINGRATPHMLRHRYITLQVVSRLQSMKKQNIGLEAISTILSRVASLSGHSSLQSLWVYVDWAFDELDVSYAYSEKSNSSALELVEVLLDESRKEGNHRLVDGLEQIQKSLLDDHRANTAASVLAHSFRKT